MKKLLLIALTIFVSTSLFAQQKATFDKSMLVPVNVHMEKQIATPVGTPSKNNVNTARRSKETGLYYYKAEGSMYNNYVYDLYGNGDLYCNYQTTTLYPAFFSYTLRNMSNNPTSCHWYSSDGYTDKGYDLTNYTDSNGNLMLTATANLYGTYNPVLYNSSETQMYTMEYMYDEMKDEIGEVYWGMCLGDGDLERESYLDYEGRSFVDNSHAWLNNKDYTPWGSLENNNIAGTGTITWQGTRYTCYAVWNTYPEPAGPLYAEYVRVFGVSIGSNEPLKNGAELTMEIYDGSGDEYVLKETLTASADDCTKWSTNTRGSERVTFYSMDFKKTTYDEIWGEELEPIVIDYPSVVYIKGFDNSDVDFGINAYVQADCDEKNATDEEGYEIEHTKLSNIKFDCVSSAGDEISLQYDGISLNPVFMDAIMDGIYAADEMYVNDNDILDGFSVIRISDDGKECHSYYQKENSELDLGGLYVNTACQWTNEFGDENYYYTIYETTDEDNDWIIGVKPDEYLSYYYYPYFYYILTFEAEALPSNMEGRSAIIFFHGRGFTDPQPVVLMQGDTEVPDGINSVLAPTTTKAPRGTYAINGQRVSDNAKGIVIKDGKKVLNK